MKRRHYLALMWASLAGCSGSDPDRNQSSVPSETQTLTKAPVERQPALSPPNATALTEEEVELMLSGPDCSAITETEVYCTQPDAPEDAPVVASAEFATATLPATTTVTLENRHDEKRFVHTAADWNLHKATNEGWRYIGPTLAQADLDIVSPGGTHRWELTFESAPQRMEPNPDPRHLAGLGPGVYAITNEGDFRGNEEPAGIVDPVTVAAVFGFAGQHPTIRPPEAVQTANGYRIELTPDEDSSDWGVTETVVERTETADVELAFEQVTQKTALRAAFPYLLADDPPDRVTVAAPQPTGDATSYLNTVVGTTNISLFGEAFEVS